MALRFEPAFYSKYLAGTDKAGKYGAFAACSVGLLQIMFVVAREDGFTGEPWDLFKPDVNLDVGTRHLATLRKRIIHAGGAAVTQAVDQQPTLLVRATLAAYNGGLAGNVGPPLRNQAYVEKVIAQWRRLRDARQAVTPTDV